jgi:hypothetical protein
MATNPDELARIRPTTDETRLFLRLHERLERQGAKPKQRHRTPLDDEFMALRLLRCVDCSGAVRLDSTAKLVYAKLAWRLQSRENQDFSEQRLADDLGVDPDTIALATRKLERCGLLTVLRNRGRKRWNNYTVTPLERLHHIGGMFSSLHAVFEPGVEPSYDDDLTAVAHECCCRFKRPSKSVVHPNISDAVHPNISDAVHPNISVPGIRTPRMPAPNISEPISKDGISKDGKSKESYFVAASGSLARTAADERKGTGDGEGTTDPAAALQSDPSPNRFLRSNGPQAEATHGRRHPNISDAREQVGAHSEYAISSDDPLKSSEANATPPRPPLPEPDYGMDANGEIFNHLDDDDPGF